MIVIIKSFDPIKGTGTYQAPRSPVVASFSYKQLYCEELIPVGAKARLKGQKLYPYYTLWQHIKDIIQEVRDRWLS